MRPVSALAHNGSEFSRTEAGHVTSFLQYGQVDDPCDGGTWMMNDRRGHTICCKRRTSKGFTLHPPECTSSQFVCKHNA
jgi:hypothetical protein